MSTFFKPRARYFRMNRSSPPWGTREGLVRRLSGRFAGHLQTSSRADGAVSPFFSCLQYNAQDGESETSQIIQFAALFKNAPSPPPGAHRRAGRSATRRDGQREPRDTRNIALGLASPRGGRPVRAGQGHRPVVSPSTSPPANPVRPPTRSGPTGRRRPPGPERAGSVGPEPSGSAPEREPLGQLSIQCPVPWYCGRTLDDEPDCTVASRSGTGPLDALGLDAGEILALHDPPPFADEIMIGDPTEDDRSG